MAVDAAPSAAAPAAADGKTFTLEDCKKHAHDKVRGQGAAGWLAHRA
jgi:hypothetical protein